MNKRLYSSLLLALLLSLTFVSAALVTEPANGFSEKVQKLPTQFIDKQLSGTSASLTSMLFRYTEPISLEAAVILYVLLLVFLIIFSGVFSFIGGFQSVQARLFGGLVVSVLVSLTSAYSFLTSLLISKIDSMGTNTGKFIVLVVLVLLLIFIGYAIAGALLRVSHTQNVAAAERTGYLVGKGNERDSATTELLREVGKNLST